MVDDGGNVVAIERLDNTFAAGANIAVGKARTAALFKKPTSFFEDVVAKGRTAMVALEDFTPLKGGIPITVDGQIVGAIGVSGAASADRDEQVAAAGAAALASPSPAGAVTFFDKAAVDASFAKGGVLHVADKFMVHTSRRDAAGQVEIHTEDSDIIYVLEGTATFVTGGKIVGAKTVAPGEIRGTDVEGGDVRTLAKGDVIVVPAGTAHWFKSVSGPFEYYTVKSR